MIATGTHIAVSLAFLAGPTQAQEPVQSPESVPPCYLRLHEGWQIRAVDQYGNGFVAYFASNQNDTASRIYLEHCPSGRVMRAEHADDYSLPYGHPRHPDSVYGLYEGLMTSPRPVTQSQVAQALRERGAETKIWNSGVESCVCNAFYPEDRGGKRAYAEGGE